MATSGVTKAERLLRRMERHDGMSLAEADTKVSKEMWEAREDRAKSLKEFDQLCEAQSSRIAAQLVRGWGKGDCLRGNRHAEEDCAIANLRSDAEVRLDPDEGGEVDFQYKRGIVR